MIGEKPENLANWMTRIFEKKHTEVESQFDSERKGDEPNWPTEDAPPQHDKRIIPVVTLTCRFG